MGNDVCACYNDTPVTNYKEQSLAKEAKQTTKIAVTDKTNVQIKDIKHIKIETVSTNARRDNDNMLNFISQEFTNKCSTIDDCLSVKRIGEALKFYGEIGDNKSQKGDGLILSDCLLLEQYLCEKYRNLMNDYGHIIYRHLDSKNNDAQFKQIYDYLINEYGVKCGINECSKYGRNCRNIQKQLITINNDDNNNQEKVENIYDRMSAYIDMFDTIHCNLLHSYDTGFRINKTELDIVKVNDFNKQTNTDSDADDLNVNVDEYMVKMSKTVSSKRKSLKRGSFDRIKNNKFLTVFNEKTKQDNCKIKKILFIEEMFDHLATDESIDKSILIELKVYLDEEEYDTDSIYDEIGALQDDKCNLFFNLKSNNNESKENCISRIREFIEKKPIAKYSFGEEWCYLSDDEQSQISNLAQVFNINPSDIMFEDPSLVMAKYKSLKREMIEHDAFETFNNLYVKVETFYAENNEHIKQKICNKYDKRGIPVSMEHLLALKLYTDTTELSAEFSRSFRKLSNDSITEVKKRNREFAHWSRLLKELVNIYGEDAFYSAGNNTYYHGTSYMIFNRFSTRFCAPTSTTKQLEVALTFIPEGTGILLELNSGAYVDCMIFNAAFLSCFGNEDERLLFCGRREWRFASIKLLETDGCWYDYRCFVRAFSGYHAVLQGIWSGKISKKSGNIMKALVNHVMLDSVVEVSSYIEDTFIAFCNQITEIKINFYYFPFSNEYYKRFFISNYSEKTEKQNEKLCLNFINIVNAKKKLWRNLQTVSYYKLDHNPPCIPELIDVDSKYLLALHKEICAVEHHESILKGMQISIPFTKYANFNESEYLELKQKFSPYQLTIEEYETETLSETPSSVFCAISIQC